jgi:MFS family permease
LLTSAFVELATQFDVTLTRFSSSVNGALIMSIAGGSIICNSLAVVYGKRPVYLITSVLLMVTSFWAAGSNSLASLTAARCIQGLSMAPMEALIPASIGDVWFVHERGFRSAIFNLGVLGGINLASPIAGTIIQNYGWKVSFWIMGGFCGAQTLLVFFFMPESAYHRPDVLNLDLGSHENVADALKYEKEHDHHDLDGAETVTDAQGNVIPGPAIRTPSIKSQKHSYLRELLPYSGYNSHDNIIKIMIRPFALLASPVVIWATLLFTTCISWLVGISVTISQIFSAPPYNFTVGQVGLTNLSSFVASLLATLIAEPLTDGIARFMARKNNGVYGTPADVPD